MSQRNIVIIVAILAILGIAAWTMGWFASDTAVIEPAPPAQTTTQSPPPVEPAPAAGPDTGAVPPPDVDEADPALPEGTDDTTAPVQQQ